MKMLKSLFFIIGIFTLGCEGPPGLEGLPGRDGADGIDGVDGEESFVFEYEVDFTAPEYSILLNIPDDFTMLDSDVMLMYLLWEIDDNDLEIWRAVPQTLYLDDGILNYNYDYTKFDATIFLDGTINLDGLGASYTDNWIVRIVVVPGQFVDARTNIDFNDYNQVREHFSLSPSKLASADYLKKPD